MSDFASRCHLDPKWSEFLQWIKEIYGNPEHLLLHEPYFGGREKEYLCECIDSTFVSSVGPFVEKFEAQMRDLTGAKHAIACVNGTAALQVALRVAGVQAGDLVITQALSFVATANAVRYLGADPVFVDVEEANLGLCPKALKSFLDEHCQKRIDENGSVVVNHRLSKRRIAAVLPMHTFGFVCDMTSILSICQEWGLPVVEDAAEALGSRFGDRSAGRYGKLAAFSFNGNKIATAGGGGCIITDDDTLGSLAKHLTTTAKIPHPFEFDHDLLGYNFRMPNINAALACAQLEMLPEILSNKIQTGKLYATKCREMNVNWMTDVYGKGNQWLGAVALPNAEQKNEFLALAGLHGVQIRPLWKLLPDLKPFEGSICGDLSRAQHARDIWVNVPSGYRKTGVKP